MNVVLTVSFKLKRFQHWSLIKLTSDNDTDLSHFFLHSLTTVCAFSFQSSTCNSDIFSNTKSKNTRKSKQNNRYRTSTKINSQFKISNAVAWKRGHIYTLLAIFYAVCNYEKTRLATANRSRVIVRSQPCRTFLTSSFDYHLKFGGFFFCAHVLKILRMLGGHGWPHRSTLLPHVLL